MSENYQIEPISACDGKRSFARLAELHQQEIEAGFLSSLGTDFLSRLYEALARSPHAFVLVAKREEAIAGFICGSTSTKRVYRSLLLNGGWRIALPLLPKLFSLKRVRRMLETILYPSQKHEVELPDAEIVNFCVDRNSQRQGIGRKLFAALVTEFQQRGVAQIRIVTGESQRSAQQFYESLGATQAAELEVHSGARSLAYLFDIPRTHQTQSPQAA